MQNGSAQAGGKPQPSRGPPQRCSAPPDTRTQPRPPPHPLLKSPACPDSGLLQTGQSSKRQIPGVKCKRPSQAPSHGAANQSPVSNRTHCLLFSLSSFLTPAWPTAGPGRPGHCPPQPPQVSSDEDAASLGRQPSLEAVAIPGEESPEAHRALRVDASTAPSSPGRVDTASPRSPRNGARAQARTPLLGSVGPGSGPGCPDHLYVWHLTPPLT